MTTEPHGRNPRTESIAYQAGRKLAPYLIKARWAMKSLVGNQEARIRTEEEMGGLLARLYENKVPVGMDLDEDRLLNEIGSQLASRLKSKKRHFRFRCDRSGVPNALALPGGYIYVSRDLVAMCREDRDCLAFVLAHEMGHVVGGDAGRRFLTQAAVNALLNIRTRASAALTPALRKLFGQLVKQGFSREQEFQADRFGTVLTRAAGFNPEGGCRLLEKLRNLSRDNVPLSEYFCSHPPLADRIDRIREEIAKPS